MDLLFETQGVQLNIMFTAVPNDFIEGTWSRYIHTANGGEKQFVLERNQLRVESQPFQHFYIFIFRFGSRAVLLQKHFYVLVYNHSNIVCIYFGGLSDIVSHLNESYRHGEL